ncbi:MAG: hypothetical protein CFE24_13875 [Flavobacterium sp. BFFFF2]|nr:MAG: hypothetical protein CFE24_13875 [Flavobacterium sp. BFFFF2]
MKKKLSFLLFLFYFSFINAQDMTFSYVGKYENIEKLKQIADSINKPLLVTEDKIFSIGSDCLTHLFDGSINDRNSDGNSDDRYKDGDSDERKKGGGIVERTKKSNRNNRNKEGKFDERDEDGDVNDRYKDGASENRNSNGSISDGPRCSYSKNGKILLYTRQNINAKKSQIYYKNKFYSNKYFKIIQL